MNWTVIKAFCSNLFSSSSNSDSFLRFEMDKSSALIKNERISNTIATASTSTEITPYRIPTFRHFSSEQSIPYEVRLNYNEQRDITNPLVDVIFRIYGGKRIGAHRFILVDGPPIKFFHERLQDKTATQIDIPKGISAQSVDSIISHIYGKQLPEIGITSHNVGNFLEAAKLFGMEFPLLSKIVMFSGPVLANYIASNFDRLCGNENFWNLDNRLLLDLCRGIMEPTVVLSGFFEFICSDQRKNLSFLKKISDLQELIEKSGGDDNNNFAEGSIPNQENQSQAPVREETVNSATVRTSAANKRLRSRQANVAASEGKSKRSRK